MKNLHLFIPPFFEFVETFKKGLDAVQYQGLRLCLGAFRNSPVDSLYVEANEPPFDLHRLKLTLQYIVKLKANIENSAFDCFSIYTTPKNVLNQSALESYR